MEGDDRRCNLECIEKAPPPVHEFIGPVKIILVDPPKHLYSCKKWCASFISLANVLLGINFILTYFFSLAFNYKSFAINTHIYLCTLGLQFASFTGILAMNGLFGPSAPLKRFDRKMQHFLMQILGAVCGIGGGLMVIFKVGWSECFNTWHSQIGVFAVLFTGISVITGPSACFSGSSVFSRCSRATHRYLAYPMVLSSSMCYLFGVWKDSFRTWFPLSSIPIFMIIFCVIYTIIVCMSPCMKCENKAS